MSIRSNSFTLDTLLQRRLFSILSVESLFFKQENLLRRDSLRKHRDTQRKNNKISVYLGEISAHLCVPVWLRREVRRVRIPNYQVITKADWNKKAIEERENKLLAWAEKTWG